MTKINPAGHQTVLSAGHGNKLAMSDIILGNDEVDKSSEIVVRGLAVVEFPKNGTKNVIPVHYPTCFDRNLPASHDCASDLLWICWFPRFRRGDETQSVFEEVVLSQITGVEALFHGGEVQAPDLDRLDMDIPHR